jgi:uncharacterized protein (TIGR03083 family)
MENARFLECLESDFWRFREVAPGRLEGRVPSCPDWTVADLTRHVAEVYLHKVEMMRHGAHPEGWPPAAFLEEEPIGLLTRGYGELRAEFDARRPEDVSKTWYEPDQTVGFWVRRMAQETVIHRIDAELGAAAPIAPVPADLAVDGIDELLKVFVAYAFSQWPEDFTDALQNSPGRTFLIRTDATTGTPSVSWLVSTAPDHLTVEGGPTEKTDDNVMPDVTISGTPTAILRWAWNRETPGTPTPLTIKGTPEAQAELRQCVVAATQ